MRKKLIAILATILMVASLLPINAFTATAAVAESDTTAVIGGKGGATSYTIVVPKGADIGDAGSSTTVTSLTETTAAAGLAAGWYVVDSTCTYTGNIEVKGDINIILMDGCSFTLKGRFIDTAGGYTASVNYDHNITFWGQSAGTGEFIADVEGDDVYTPISAHVLTINGGKVSSKCQQNDEDGDRGVDAYYFVMNGGALSVTSDADAIYVDDFTMNAGTIEAYSLDEGIDTLDFTMNAGTIEVSSSDDGISTKNFTMNAGTIEVSSFDDGIYAKNFTMNGGIIKVTSDWDGIFIGSEGNMTVNGGKIYATATDEWGAGICLYYATATINDGAIAATGLDEGIDVDGSALTVKGGYLALNYDSDYIDDELFIDEDFPYYDGMYVDEGATVELSGGTIIAFGIHTGISVMDQSSIQFDGSMVMASALEYVGMDVYASSAVFNDGDMLMFSGAEHGINLECSPLTINGGGIVAWTNGDYYFVDDNMYSSAALYTDNLVTINGGEVIVYSEGSLSDGIYLDYHEDEDGVTHKGELIVNGGTLGAAGDACGIYASKDCSITVNGGKLLAESETEEKLTYQVPSTGETKYFSANGIASAYGDITINGGEVESSSKVGCAFYTRGNLAIKNYPEKVMVGDAEPGTELEGYDYSGINKGYKYVMIYSDNEKGNIEISTDNQKSNFSAGSLANSTEEIIAAVLTDEDKAAIASGKGVKVWANISDISGTVSSDMVQLIKNSLPENYVTGLYLDINLLKQIGTNDASKVTKLANGKLKISLQVPSNLIKSGRTYKIVRIHDGVATVLDAAVDENNVLTFETDEFSTYAVIYSDGAVSPSAGDSKSNESATASPETVDTTVSPKTGDSAGGFVLYILLLTISVGVIVGIRKEKFSIR